METITQSIAAIAAFGFFCGALGHALPGKAGVFFTAVGFDIEKILRAFGK